MEWRGTFKDRFGDTFRLCCDDKTLQGAIEYFIENILEQEKKRINCQKVPEKVVLNGVEYKPVNK